MSTPRFAEVHNTNQQSLSLLHMHEFLKRKNLETEISFYSADVLESLIQDKQKLKSFHFLRVTYESSQKILETWGPQPTQVRLLGCCDTFLHEGKSFVPRVILYEALREAIVSKISNYDIKDAGYVICNDMKGRLLISLLLSLGHRKVFLVGENEEFIDKEVEFLQRFHIGTEILGLPAHHLTLQTTRASILINTIDFTDDDTILNDLVYFNFMKNGGAILDLNFEKSKSVLLEEAQRASLKTLSSSYVSSFYDFSLMSKLNLGLDFSFEEFEKSWSQFLAEKVQNSP